MKKDKIGPILERKERKMFDRYFCTFCNVWIKIKFAMFKDNLIYIETILNCAGEVMSNNLSEKNVYAIMSAKMFK